MKGRQRRRWESRWIGRGMVRLYWEEQYRAVRFELRRRWLDDVDGLGRDDDYTVSFTRPLGYGFEMRILEDGDGEPVVECQGWGARAVVVALRGRGIQAVEVGR